MPPTAADSHKHIGRTVRTVYSYSDMSTRIHLGIYRMLYNHRRCIYDFWLSMGFIAFVVSR